MEKISTLILAAALVLVVLAWWWRPAPADAPALTAVGDPALLNALTDELAQLREEQQQLQARLARIEGVPSAVAAPLVEVDTAEEAEAEVEEETAPVQQPPSQQRIDQAGLTTDEFSIMEDRAQALYRENFELEWRARRERYLAGEQRPDARQRLRAELGDDAYDRYLYASGQSNRVRVRRVMPDSAAARAGIAEGDLLLSYDSERLFGFDDLRRASYQGEPGDSVIVEVRRQDGSQAQLALPRGPLGISSSGGWREVPGS